MTYQKCIVPFSGIHCACTLLRAVILCIDSNIRMWMPSYEFQISSLLNNTHHDKGSLHSHERQISPLPLSWAGSEYTWILHVGQYPRQRYSPSCEKRVLAFLVGQKFVFQTDWSSSSFASSLKKSGSRKNSNLHDQCVIDHRTPSRIRRRVPVHAEREQECLFVFPAAPGWKVKRFSACLDFCLTSLAFKVPSAWLEAQGLLLLAGHLGRRVQVVTVVVPAEELSNYLRLAWDYNFTLSKGWDISHCVSLHTCTLEMAASLPSTYCRHGGAFTDDEVAHYTTHGFVVKRGLVDRESTAKYRERFRQLCSGEATCPGLTIMRDVAIARSEFVPGEKAVTKLQNFQYDDVLFEYCSHPAILPFVQAVSGPDVVAMHTMLINKPPDPGSKSSRHPLHQDLHYFTFRPANRIVCSWTALEHVHRKNGCLVVHPGSHLTNPLLNHEYPQWKGGVNKLYHGITEEHMPPEDEMVHLEMQEGDTVFFHPLLIHGSGMNRTTGFRKAISCHYASSHCRYVGLKPTQAELSAELGELAKTILAKRGQPGVDMDLEDVFKLRARLVCGQEGSLSRL